MSSTETFATNISIDFFLGIVRIYIDITEQTTEKSDNGQETLINNVIRKKKSIKIVDKKFTVSEDYNTIMIDDTTYSIPTFFNRKTMQENDKKTWEMIFYQIFNADINREIKAYKSKVK